MSNGVVRAASKPVIIEAMLFSGGAAAATPIIDWVLNNKGTARWDEEHRDPIAAADGTTITGWGDVVPEGIYIYTLEGTMRADVGDWIIRGTRGEFYPCKPDVFAHKYEILEEPVGTSPS